MADDYPPDILATALPLICTANPALLTCGTYFVAEDAQHRIIGCGGWTPERPGARPGKPPGISLGQGDVQQHIGHIRHFATHPDWIRQGVGRALITRSKDTARQHAITRLECYSSLSAQDFYAASGFQALRRMDIPLSETCLFPSILMDCPL
jgi:GNAT superfamily N-acetyltransferase